MCRRLFFLTSVLILSFTIANAARGAVTWETNITNGNDAVEDQLDRGMYMDSSDLELPNDSGLQVIGLRYVDVGVPRHATVTNAYIEFTQDETTGPEVVNLIIDGELSPDAPPFDSTDRNVVSRSRTMAKVLWSPESWPTTGTKYRTSDISSVITEFVGPDNVTLSWTPADSATSHELYFGTNKEVVRNADTNSPEYMGSKTLGNENYNPGLLETQASYYWRVDEIDDQGNTSKGPLWIFTTGTFLLVDDFDDIRLYQP